MGARLSIAQGYGRLALPVERHAEGRIGNDLLHQTRQGSKGSGEVLKNASSAA